MDANATVAEILRQDARRTRQADQRHFFQLLRAVLERDAERIPERGRARDA